ncbi:hypothetical protein [Ideonella sp. A 288]|uniref:hypothetical protein n=1 Tax=Ideonella sp. A 288 TaxID=1962181 RepID=UPI0011870EC3|nr:hypothetical protein [Ideonella sp. A 288]
MKSMKYKGALCAVALAATTFAAHADLARVGPRNLPSPAGHGFPLWYQDLNGLALDLCLPNATDPGSLQMTACLQTTPAPYAFPGGFPDEAFFFRGTSDLALPNGLRAVLVTALEAAFGGGAAAVNDQVVFTRIRITAGVPEPGNYVFTHPYGVRAETVDAATGARDITYTLDQGLVPLEFTGALRGQFGPFLRAADAAGAALAPVTLNGAQFLSDGTPTRVTGSPFNTNIFMMCGTRFDGTPIVLGNAGPNGNCASTNLFTLTGRLHDMVASPIGSPLSVPASTYSRDANGTHINVSAQVGRALATQPVPLLTAASAQTPPVRMQGPDVLDRYFTQGFTDPTGTLPGQVTVTNSGDNPPTSVVAGTNDVVTIVSNSYDASTQTLTVVATSSDKGFGTSLPPNMAIEGLVTTVTPGGIAGDPASQTLVATGVAIPPSQVIVQSTAGGIGRADLATNPNLAYAAGSPFTRDDTISVEAGTAPVVIPVLANDLANVAAPINPASLTILAPGLAPNLGTLTPNLVDGTVTFTPGPLVGTATFRYTVSSAAVPGASNVSTVTVNVTAPAGGPVPVTVADSTVVVATRTATINVLANDSGNGGALDPASVLVDPASVTGGTVSVNPTTGVVSFTAGATLGTTFGFNYTVANVGGNRSASSRAAVRIRANEAISVAAGADCTRSSNRWRMSGTGVEPNATITLYTTGTVPAAPTAAQTVATVTANATGAWAIDRSGGPACTSSTSLRTQLASVRNGIAVRIR